MKYLFFPIIFFCFISCKSEPKSQPFSIASHDIEEMVSFLASDELDGRHTGSEGIDNAAKYIESKFKAFGVKPYFDSYRDHFKLYDSIDAFNVVGFIEGNNETLRNEIILIGAHYDHIGSGNNARKKSRKGSITETDTIANGANDNASGSAAVLALAKYFAQTKSNDRSIMFALFSAEEFGIFGSKHLSERLKAENLDLYAMVNFEMIGVPLKDTDHLAFITGYDMSNMAKKMNAYSEGNAFGSSEISKRNNLFKRSDNFPFYEQFNVPCHTISSCDLTNYDYYHHSDDEVSELNYEFMEKIINKTIIAVEQMSMTPTKEIVMYESE